jgi:tungstate transport system substrate-binding protein
MRALFLAALVVLAGCTPSPNPQPQAPNPLILATTTSTQDSGLLDALLPLFEQQGGYQVKTVAVGTGAALVLGARGEADVVLAHAPEAERQWMAQGNGTERLLVMHNDFVIVGPPHDPARVAGETLALRAFRRIAEAGAPFLSRGDDSGTHQRERALWKEAQLEPTGQPWYVEAGGGMSQTLTIADQKAAYTLTDRSTWLARKAQLGLRLVLENDPPLFNLYHVMPVNPGKFPPGRINTAGGKAFADFLVSAQAQQAIATYGQDKYGQPLFFPDAGKREDEIAPL